MQWATCADTQALITTLGGGTGPTRTSVYDDPRVVANAKVGAGTTRHLPVVRETIAKQDDFETLVVEMPTARTASGKRPLAVAAE